MAGARGFGVARTMLSDSFVGFSPLGYSIDAREEVAMSNSTSVAHPHYGQLVPNELRRIVRSSSETA